MSVSISELGLRLIVFEDQIKAAIKEERRWRGREMEAMRNADSALDRIQHYNALIEETINVIGQA